MPLHRTTRLLLIIPAILLAIFLSLAVLISVFYEQEVKQLMVTQLNKHLRAEIKVDDFDFSILRHFPFAAFRMSNVLVKESGDPVKADTLLFAERIELLFNLTGLLEQDFTVRRIVIADGLSHIRIDKDGRPNYEIWDSDSTGGSTDIDLSKVQLKQMTVTYTDYKNDQQYAFRLDQLEFSGQFSDKVYTMKASGNMLVKELIAGDVNWIKSKKAAIVASLAVNTDSGSYRFEDCRIQLADVKFLVSGAVHTANDTRLDLKIAADEADLRSFISLLPEQYVSYFRNFESSGRFVFTAAINGESSAKKSPDVKADFSIRKGKLIPSGSDVPLQDIELSGSLNSASLGGKGILSVPSLSARLGANVIHARLTLEDLSQPFLSLKAATRVELSALRNFLTLDTLTALSGSAELNVNFAGKVKDLPRVNAGNLYSVQSSGTIALKDVSLSLRNNPLSFTGFSGQLELNNDDIIVHDFHGKISSSDFRLQGRFVNFITFLLIPGQSAEMNASLTAQRINLDELLLNSVTTTKSDTAYKLRVNPRLVSNLDVRVEDLQFRRFRAANIAGRIRLENQVITGNDIRFNAMQGSVQLDGSMNVSRKDSVLMSCTAQLNKLDIRQLFYEFENFDQDVMTDRNVRGRITAAVQFRSSWTTDLTIDASRVKAVGDITIDNGELNDFGPIMELSKYLKVKDLRNIRFSTLKNTVSISDRKIHIPSMEIKSSAMDLSGSGIHDFDNNIDYKIRLLLSDVLGKKVKSANSEFGEIEDDGLGRTQLFLSMKGTVDDPKISYDRKAVGDKIKQEAQEERKQLKELLREEFGGKKKEDPKKTEPPKKKKEEMQIEW